ncbi:hypothetical protein [uncultured Treponema sp.]|uniref:hypothetical protein n=1 Tax=uncultured Treponema sp. TaxID=162155 RepID=UPI00258A8EBA|nr:hypothetical protein [uncultured Treponema sp.]
MKRITFACSIYIFSLVLLTACATAKNSAYQKNTYIDNCFETLIKNNSSFDIEIDGTKVSAKSSLAHKFPLHNSALYDGWEVLYKIPFTNNIFFYLRNKIAITDNQSELLIGKPIENQSFDNYLILKNNSKISVQISNGISLLPCFLNGQVNSKNSNPEYYISSGNIAALKVPSDNTKLFVQEGNKMSSSWKIPLSKKNRAGFVYTYTFDGEKVVFEDARSIVKVNEPLWNKDYSDTALLKAFGSKNENTIFCIGNKIEEDKNKNNFWSAYFGCFENTGTKKWESNFSEKNADNKIYDGVLLENKIICVGQSMNEKSETGIVLFADSKNGHIEPFKIPEVSGLFSISSFESNVLAAGFDSAGSLTVLKISFENDRPIFSLVPLELPIAESNLVNHALCLYDTECEKIILLCNRQNENGEVLSSILYQFSYDGKLTLKEDFEKSIKSVSCMVQNKNGEIFVGAETFGTENTSAVVIKVLPNGNWTYFYRNENPSSFITSVCLSENEDFIVLSGVQNASDSYGHNGKSFFAGMDSNSAEKLWFTEYEKKQDMLLTNFSLVPEYGFAGIFCYTDESGVIKSPSALKRMTLNGSVLKK